MSAPINQHQKGNISCLYFLFGVVVLVVAAVSVTIGVADITPIQVLEIIAHRWFDMPLAETISQGQQMIIMDIRLPRVLMAIVIGANLAVTGALYQSLFQNAMADPFMLGVSSGASLGAAVGIVIGGFIPWYAFLGAIVANVCVMLLSGSRGKHATMRLLLSGMAINYFFSSLLAIIRTYAPDKNTILFAWGMGSLSGASYERISLLLIVSLPILGLFYCFRKELNLLSLGDDTAKTLGVNVYFLRRVFLGLSTLLVAVTVSFTGTIGFVGLIVPHAVRLMFGNNYKYTLILNLLSGMLFVLLCDNVSRAWFASSEIPLGIVTSMFGAPYFMYLIYRERKRSSL